MKYQQFRKRLLWESSIIAGGIILLGAFAFFVDDFSDDYQKGIEAKENKVHAIIASTNILNSQYELVLHNSDLLEKIVERQSRGGFTISAQTAKNQFNRFRDQYYLANMHLSMDPITQMQGDNYRLPTGIAVSSQVSIDFEGVADEYAYSLLGAVEDDLPGFSKIREFTLTRQGSVTPEALNSISEKGVAPLVKCELKFTWFGIKPVETGDNGNASQKP